MKRRKTKDRIRRLERLLSKEIQALLISHARGDGDGQADSASHICTVLTLLLSEYLELDSSWPYKERWLDGVIDGHFSQPWPDVIRVRGKMTWGLSEDVGGNQWEEPFEAIVRFSKNRRRILAYTLKFGSGEPLSNKVIESDFCYTLALEEVEGFSGEYSYQFSK